jgi:hypothetical protein
MCEEKTNKSDFNQPITDPEGKLSSTRDDINKSLSYQDNINECYQPDDKLDTTNPPTDIFGDDDN